MNAVNKIYIFASSAVDINFSADITCVNIKINLYSDWIDSLIKFIIKDGGKVIGARYFKDNLKFIDSINYYLIQDRETSDGIELLDNHRVMPLFIFCMESPLYARRFYLLFENYIHKFKYKFLISINELQKYNNIYEFVTLPLIYEHILFEKFKKENELIFIGKARLGFLWGIDLSKPNLREIVKGVYCYIYSRIYRISSNNSTSFSKVYYLYKLSKHLDTTIFGKNWSPFLIKLFNLFGCKIKYINHLEDKATALKNSKYNLVIENTEINDYITEKFFDSILNNCVPIVTLKHAIKLNKYFDIQFTEIFNLKLYIPISGSNKLNCFLQNYYHLNVAKNLYQNYLSKF